MNTDKIWILRRFGIQTGLGDLVSKLDSKKTCLDTNHRGGYSVSNNSDTEIQCTYMYTRSRYLHG